MRWRIASILLFACLACSGAQRTDSKSQLRAMARMPRMELQFSLYFDPLDGFVVLSDLFDPAAELEKARAKITKDPTDPAPYLQLGRIFDSLRDSNKAYAAYLQAIERARRQSELDPVNGLLTSDWAVALATAGRSDEAAAKHREAVAASPDEWKCWLRLGQFEERRAIESLLSQSVARKQFGAVDVLADAIRKRPPLDRVEKAQEFMSDASAHLQKAIRLSTNAPEALIQHGLFCSLSNAVRSATEVLRGADIRSDAISLAVFCQPAQREFNRALQHDPKDYRTIGLNLFYSTLLEASSHYGGDYSGLIKSDVWPNLSDETQSRARGLMARLAALGESLDTDHAAGSFEILGLFQDLILKDNQGAEQSLRNAIAQDPHRERAWDALVAVLGNAHRYEDLLEVSKVRVQAKPTQRNLVLLAKALEKTGDTAEAERQIHLALDLDSSDFLANISLANLLLKQKETESSWRIRDALTKAQKSVGGRPSRNQMIDLALTQSIYYALNDNPETARKILKGLLEVARDNNEAKQVLSVLGY